MLTATFIINEPDHLTREIQARDSLVSIGRALDNTICLADDSNVSRYHAAIERRRDGFYLSDLGSSNGTTVGGETIYGERRLRDGDLIAFGGTSIVEFYEHDAQDARVAAPPQQNSSSSSSSPSPQQNYTPEKYRSQGSAQTQTPSSSSPHGDQIGYHVGGALATGAAAGMRPASSTPSASTSSSAPAYDDFGTSTGDDSYSQPHAEADAPPVHTAPTPAAGVSPKTIAAGAAGGLALTACVALVLSGALTGGAACRGSARIVSPQTGTTLRAASVLRVESENNQCIRRLRFQINGREFANSTVSPFDVPIDPSTLPRTSGNNVLTVVVENRDGEQELQDGEVVVALAPNSAPTAAAAANATPPPSQIDYPEPTANITTGALTTPDIQAMSQRFASQISHKSGYVFAPEFADLIRQRTPEYARAGGTTSARRHRREVIKAFRDNGLDPLLGFTLAFSQSKFAAEPAGSGGLWRVPPAVAANFLAPNETPSALADPRRSAEVAAAYTKSLINTLETDDFTYAIACFGLSIDDAGEMRAKLAAADPVERRDFWKMVKAGVVPADRVDRVARFYAAGIVAENPATFGATSEQPFSSLY